MTGRPLRDIEEELTRRAMAALSGRAGGAAAATTAGQPHLAAGSAALVIEDELTRLITGILNEAAALAGSSSSDSEGPAAEAALRLPHGVAPPSPPLSSHPHPLPSASRATYAPPPPCSFLRPGQAFEGRQRVSHHHSSVPKQEHWEVHARIEQYDPAAGYIAGTMEAANVPDAPAPVTTFFEGEIIDNVNHTFYTADWDACCDTDFLHWSRFEPFRELKAEVVRHGGRCPSLSKHPWVYMRWKEQFFLRGSECRLTIAGFYYLAINRATGAVQGYYYDPSSSPDQKLELAALRAGPAGFAFPHYELA